MSEIIRNKSKLKVASSINEFNRAAKYPQQNLETNLLYRANEIAKYTESSNDHIIEEVLDIDCDDYTSHSLRDASYSSIGRI